MQCFPNILFDIHSFYKFIVSSYYESDSVQGTNVVTRKIIHGTHPLREGNLVR